MGVGTRVHAAHIISADGIGDMVPDLFDLNGDGLPALWLTRASAVAPTLPCLPHTGTGWVSAPAYTPPYIISADGIGDMVPDCATSMGKDYRIDGLRAVSGGTYVTGAYLNTGTGWVSAPAYTPPYIISADGIGDMGTPDPGCDGDGLDVNGMDYRTLWSTAPSAVAPTLPVLT